MSSDPAVSVVIPTYNGARFLREALDSVFAQTLLPCEIIVVDDRSSDGSAELAESLSGLSPVPLRVVRLEQNSGGPARPINVGIAQARGQLISILDQDDAFADDHLATKVAALAADPELTVALSWCGEFDDRAGQPRQQPALREAVLKGARQRTGFEQIDGNFAFKLLVRWGMIFVGYPAFVFRKCDWQQKGGVDESLRIASDLELLGWLLHQGDCALIDQVGYFRREHDANVCRQRANMYLEATVVRLRLWQLSSDMRRDAKLVKSLEKELLDMAFWLREGGCYRHAAQTYRLIGRLGRPLRKTVASLTRLQLVRMCRWITRRPPVSSRFTTPPDRASSGTKAA